MRGTVGILNVGVGDIKLSFDPKNPAERIRAARIVKDMLRRGFALLVEVERDGKKVFTRALDFDDNVCEYVIADFDPITAERVDAAPATESHHVHQQGEAEASSATAAGPSGSKKRVIRRNVKAESARAVAVARTAGG